MSYILLCELQKNGGFTAVLLILFVFSVVATIPSSAAVNRRRRRCRGILPLVFTSFVRLGSSPNFDENDIYADLLDALHIDEEIRLPPVEAPSPGHDDPEHSALGPGKDHIANPSKTLSVEKVYRFLPFKFAKTRFHTLLYAGACRNVTKSGIFFLHEKGRLIEPPFLSDWLISYP